MAVVAPLIESDAGYDYEFVQTPSDTLICCICFLPSREPCLSECCGNTYCKSCLKISKKSGPICPMCRSEDFVTILNKQADRIIRSLNVFCTNKEQGCEWQGEVNDITSHLGNCLFHVVHCPNECGESLQQQYLTIHIETQCARRTVSCQYCNDVGEYMFIEGQHKEECPKYPVQCPNECEIESIYRDEVEEHKKVCPLEITQCDYHVVGCKLKVAHKDIDIHKKEMIEVHLSLSVNELIEAKKQLKCSQNNLKHEVEKIKNDLTQQIVWHTTKIVDTEQQLSASQQETKKTKDDLTQWIVDVENHSSSTSRQLATVEQAANSQLENLRQQLSASQLKAEKIKEDLMQQIKHGENKYTAKLTAIQQEAEKTKDQLLHKLAATEKELSSTKQQLTTTCQNLFKAEKEHTVLAASTNRALTEMKAKVDEVITTAEKKVTEALQQKAQVIEEMCSPWFIYMQYQASKFLSGTELAPVVVKITEFTNSMKSGWVSKPFYYERRQRKVQLKVAARNFDSITYISVLVLGDYEVNLPPRCTVPIHRLVVKLLNQVSDSEHIECHLMDSHELRSQDRVDPKTHFYNTHGFVYEKLQRNTATCQYLRSDTVFFEVLKW